MFRSRGRGHAVEGQNTMRKWARTTRRPSMPDGKVTDLHRGPARPPELIFRPCVRRWSAPTLRSRGERRRSGERTNSIRRYRRFQLHGQLSTNTGSEEVLFTKGDLLDSGFPVPISTVTAGPTPQALFLMASNSKGTLEFEFDQNWNLIAGQGLALTGSNGHNAGSGAMDNYLRVRSGALDADPVGTRVPFRHGGLHPAAQMPGMLKGDDARRRQPSRIRNLTSTAPRIPGHVHRRRCCCRFSIRKSSKSVSTVHVVRYGVLGVVPTPRPQHGAPFRTRGPEGPFPRFIWTKVKTAWRGPRD